MTLSQWIDYGATFVFVGLAVYRCSVMIAQELGPFNMFSRLRGEHDSTSRGWPIKKNVLQELISCVFCLSVWFGLAGAFFLPYYGVGWFFVSAFALSGFATLWVKRLG